MDTSANRTELIKARGISKSFGVVQALDNVDFTVHKGEIMGLAGHNGAGKSVLLKTLCGIVHPDSGDLWYADAKGPIVDIQSTQEWGLFLVPQELSLSTGLSVAENVFIGRKEFSNRGLVNKKVILEKTKRMFKDFFDMEIDPLAERIGAVNTLVRLEHGLRGTIRICPGCIGHLREIG